MFNYTEIDENNSNFHICINVLAFPYKIRASVFMRFTLYNITIMTKHLIQLSTD